MRRPTHPSSWSENLMGLLVLAALAGIGYWVYQQQFALNPALLETAAASAELGVLPPSPPPRPACSWSSYLPDGLVPVSARETFGPETLSDKIDGRADLYLASGFVNLECQRFAHAEVPEAGLEVLVYDMGNLRQAFAVYSAQRREESEDADVGAYSYRTPNALFFVHGKYYVEIISPDASEGIAEDLETFARRFTAGIPAAKTPIPELALLPTQHLEAGSVVLYLADGLGFDRFDNLFAASYRVADTELTTGFLTVRPSAAEAASLAKAYADSLLANGGAEEESLADIPGARLVNLFGTYELVFVHGAVVAGVHEAESKEAAEELAGLLYAKLSGSGT